MAESLEDWRRSHAWFVARPDRLVVKSLRGTLDEGLATLLPLATPRRHELLWACVDDRWTGYFDSTQSSDAVTAINGLCIHSGLTGLVVTIAKVPLGRRGWDLSFVMHEGAEARRALSLTWEGRLSFDTYGEPLPFEVLENYERRLKRERLTPEIIRSYCEKIGILAWDDAFYGDRGVLLADLQGARAVPDAETGRSELAQRMNAIVIRRGRK